MAQVDVLKMSSPLDNMGVYAPPYAIAYEQQLSCTLDVSVPSIPQPAQQVFVPEALVSEEKNTDIVEDVDIPSLPPLFVGHTDVQIRDRIMEAMQSSDLLEPDAEKAFFVADLSRVWRQHQRWLRCLPGIEPFYGS